MVNRQLYDELRGLVRVAILVLAVLPTRTRRRGKETVAWGRQRVLLLQAERDANDIRRIGFKNQRAALQINLQLSFLGTKACCKADCSEEY